MGLGEKPRIRKPQNEVLSSRKPSKTTLAELGSPLGSHNLWVSPFRSYSPWTVTLWGQAVPFLQQAVSAMAVSVTAMSPAPKTLPGAY